MTTLGNRLGACRPLVEPPATYDTSAVIAAASQCGLRQPGFYELVAARTMAERMIGCEIAPIEALIFTNHYSGLGSFVFAENGRITGVYAMLLLSRAGFLALQHGSFDTRFPEPEHLVRPGRMPAAHYGWGIAASTKTAARAVLSGTMAMHEVAFMSIPYVIRAATDDGRRAMLDRGGRPVPWGDPDAYWYPPETEDPA